MFEFALPCMYSHPAKNVHLSVRHRICYYSIIWKGKEALHVYIIENLFVGAVSMYSSPLSKYALIAHSKYEGA